MLMKSPRGVPLTELCYPVMQTPEEKFEQELAWCIEKMELGLLTQKPDKKLGRGYMKLLFQCIKYTSIYSNCCCVLFNF